MMKTIRNSKGMTLVELTIAAAILVIVSVAVTDVMMRTAREVMAQSRENMAETSAKNVLMRIAEDVRKATFTSSHGAFWDASDSQHLYITVRENKDMYSVPDNGDNNDDISCYEFRQGIGEYSSKGYIPGLIMAGSDSGDSTCEANSYSVISDSNIDIVDLDVRYCRPVDNGGVPGSYQCTISTTNGSLATDSHCVWLVRMSISARRMSNLYFPAGEHEPHPVAVYTTAVKPRNLYLGALATDSDKNDVVDCCDANHVGADVTWCPPPTKF